MRNWRCAPKRSRSLRLPDSFKAAKGAQGRNSAAHSADAVDGGIRCAIPPYACCPVPRKSGGFGEPAPASQPKDRLARTWSGHPRARGRRIAGSRSRGWPGQARPRREARVVRRPKRPTAFAEPQTRPSLASTEGGGDQPRRRGRASEAVRGREVGKPCLVCDNPCVAVARRAGAEVAR
jgi:hypothetical protein